MKIIQYQTRNTICNYSPIKLLSDACIIEIFMDWMNMFMIINYHSKIIFLPQYRLVPNDTYHQMAKEYLSYPSALN